MGAAVLREKPPGGGDSAYGPRAAPAGSYISAAQITGSQLPHAAVWHDSPQVPAHEQVTPQVPHSWVWQLRQLAPQVSVFAIMAISAAF